MKITITIEKCRQCTHIDHSGGFTPGGAKSICGHPEIVNTIMKVKGLPRDGANDPNVDPTTKAWYWKNRIIDMPDKNVIPTFCPLLNGCKY